MGVLLAAFAFRTAAAQVGQAITITSEPVILAVGEEKIVEFIVSSPPGATGYGAFTVDITYNPALVTLQCGASVPDPGRATCNPTFTSNKLRLVDVSFGGFKNGVLARVRIIGKSPGAFSFQYNIVDCDNPLGDPITGCTGSGGGVQVEGGAVPTSSITLTPSITPSNTPTKTATPTTSPSTLTPTPGGPKPFRAIAVGVTRLGQ